jgi:flagellar motor switch/type III secretory pathway protein FliN
MAQTQTLVQASVEVTAVLSTASVASGRLASLADGEAIEITPDAIVGPIVTLKAAGKPIARAHLHRAEDRLLATIIEIGDTPDGPLDEWCFTRKASPPPADSSRSDA